MNWKQLGPVFEPDGALRDIYVLDATMADWQAVLDAVWGWTPTPVFKLGGEVSPLPDRIETIFDLGKQRNTALSLFVDAMRLNCFFFDPEEIEFDLDPAEVAGPLQLTALLGFMRHLSALTHKPAILTEENYRTNPIFRILPGVADLEIL